MKQQNRIRIEEFLSSQSAVSRRDVADMIRAGRVTLNGTPVSDLTQTFDPKLDVIHVDKQRLVASLVYYYYKFYKPVDVISSMDDPNGRVDLRSFMKQVPPQIMPIGRLDRDSEGLLLFTNNGELSQRLSHPRFHIGKEYRVTLDRPFSPMIIDRLLTGFFLDDGPVQFQAISIVSEVSLQITIAEGRNRIVRRAFALLGYTVKKLKRLSIGPIQLGQLKAGKFSPLTESELRQLDQILDFR